MKGNLLETITQVLQTFLLQEDKTEQKFDALFSEMEKLKEGFSKKEDDEFLTIKQVCNLVKKGRTTIWRWADKGLLVPFGKSGKSPLYKKSDVMAFLSQKTELV